MTTIIKVTAEHIKQGKRDSCYHCPIALAIADVVEDSVSVAVLPSKAELCHRATFVSVSMPLPTIAQIFISTFDACMKTQPFEFELDIPAEYLIQN